MPLHIAFNDSGTCVASYDLIRVVLRAVLRIAFLGETEPLRRDGVFRARDRLASFVGVWSASSYESARLAEETEEEEA